MNPLLEAEQDLLSGLLARVSVARETLEYVAPQELSVPTHRAIYQACLAVDDEINGRDVEDPDTDLFSVMRQLDGNPAAQQAIADLYDRGVAPALAFEHAIRVRDLRIHEELAQLGRSLEGSHEDLKDTLGTMRTLVRRLEPAPEPLHGLGFHGERLREVREQDEPLSPLPDLLDSHPSLTIVAGKPKVGKTTLATYLAACWAAGVAPWQGTGRLPGSRALILSAEQRVKRIDRTLCRLDVHHEGLQRAVWTDRIVILARDRTLPRSAHTLLRMNAEGLAALEAGLNHARSIGDPIELVVMDSLSRLKPLDVSENDNDAMTGWLEQLQELAERAQAWLLLIHHEGKTDHGDVRDAPRGASAITAVAQAVWRVQLGAPRQRSVSASGNAILERSIDFGVAPENAEEGEILFWRRIEGSVSTLESLWEAGESLHQSALAWRIAGDDDPEPGARPPGAAQRQAKALIRLGLQRGILQEADHPGPRKARLYTRISADSVLRAEDSADGEALL